MSSELGISVVVLHISLVDCIVDDVDDIVDDIVDNCTAMKGQLSDRLQSYKLRNGKPEEFEPISWEDIDGPILTLCQNAINTVAEKMRVDEERDNDPWGTST